MPKPRTKTGEKNLISTRLKELRELHGLSQRDLARALQLSGTDMDKNVITRIETNKRYVTDLELKALSELFHVSYAYLIDGEEKKTPLSYIFIDKYLPISNELLMISSTSLSSSISMPRRSQMRQLALKTFSYALLQNSPSPYSFATYWLSSIG